MARDKEKHKLAKQRHYRLNKEKYYKRVYDYRNKNKEFIFVYKSKKGCFFCKEKNAICLEFHHLDPTKKEHKLGHDGKFLGKEKLIKEIEKCIVICANCHRKLHAGQLKCEVTSPGVEPGPPG